MIYISSDHAGFNLKEEIKKLLETDGHEFADLGLRKIQGVIIRGMPLV